MSDETKSEQGGGPRRPHATLDLKAERAEQNAEQDSAADNPGDTVADERPSEPLPMREGGGAAVFLTHLAAGLLGGLIALMAGYYALGQFRDRLPFVSEISAEQIKAEQEALSQRISEVATSTNAARAELAERLSALDTRTEGLAQTDNEAVQALTSRVNALEQQVQRVSDSTDDAARTERFATVSQRLTEVEESVASLQNSLQQIRTRTEQNIAATRASALGVAVSNLRRAVARGETYSAELTAVRELSAENLEIDTLSAAAETGAPTLAGLRGSFARYANRALDAAGSSGDESIIGQIVESARSVVNVRPVGEIEGDSPSAIIARIENRLKAGDLAGVATQGEQLEGAPAQQLAPWLEQVRTRINADRELDVLEADLLAAANQ